MADINKVRHSGGQLYAPRVPASSQLPSAEPNRELMVGPRAQEFYHIMTN